MVQMNAAFPSSIKVSSMPGSRSAEQLLAVIAALDPASNPRYAIRDSNGDGKSDTFCNIFRWDFTRAMNVVFPHWVDQFGNEAAPAARGARELSANASTGWIRLNGDRYGWARVDPATARLYALAGKPSIGLWSNPRGPGHEVVLIPTPNRAIGLWVAQAGRSNFNAGPITRAFGLNLPPELEFWVNE